MQTNWLRYPGSMVGASKVEALVITTLPRERGCWIAAWIWIVGSVPYAPYVPVFLRKSWDQLSVRRMGGGTHAMRISICPTLEGYTSVTSAAYVAA